MGQNVKKDGFYANGKQRWFCKTCKSSFNWDNTSSKLYHEQIWFERWIFEGYSVRQLVNQSGHSRAKIYRIIDYWLARFPPESREQLSEFKYLVFDGTFLHRPTTIVVLMDALANTVISGKFGTSEKSNSQLIDFFQPLVNKGLDPISCTTDGNPNAIYVIKGLWPNIIIQRCLVHIQRQGLSWCRNYPKTAYARQLRNIFLRVCSIRSHQDKERFIDTLVEWEEKYGDLVSTGSNRGRVFSDIQRARSMLIRALPDMFHYLDDPNIARTTNGLEGYHSRLKSHYRQHRGLSKEKRASYFAWYFYFRPK